MGCRFILLALVALVFAAGAGGAALFHYYRWHALWMIPLAAILFMLIARRLLKQLFLIPFRMKGKVLKDARVQVHEVVYLGLEKEPDPPSNENEEEEGASETPQLPESTGPENETDKTTEPSAAPMAETPAEAATPELFHAYSLDLTVTPQQQGNAPFGLWDPGELMAVAPEAKSALTDDSEEFANLAELFLYENGAWIRDFDKLEGTARLRIKFHLHRPERALKLRYYFHDLAEIKLPPAMEPSR
jgi:hypothetical protein